MQKKNILRYSIIITLSGPKALTKMVTKDIQKTIRPLTKTFKTIDNQKYKLALALKSFLPTNLKNKLPVLSTIWNYIHGIPSHEMLSFAYWRSGASPSSTHPDPAKDKCGIIWYAPILPFEGKAILEFEKWSKDICKKHNMNHMFNITNFSDNFCIALIPIMFDQRTQTEQAKKCYIDLLQSGLENGIAPYRMANIGMSNIFDKETLDRKLKHLIDPDNTLSPGRYSSPP